MSGAGIPPLPQQLKQIQHYLKTATEHDKRDPVVSYYCRLYALQSGMVIDKKSPDCRMFHVALMDYLEKVKKTVNSEAITNEVVGQAHMESYALKVFLYADNEDRASRFNKNVVKSFYTAGMLFDTLSVFGELSEDIEKNRKYAKWKAAYIHRCLKNGETPEPGPLGGEDGEEGGMNFGDFGVEASGGAIGFEQRQQPGPAPGGYIPQTGPYIPSPTGSTHSLPTPNSHGGTPMGAHAPPTTPQEPYNGAKAPPSQPLPVATAWKPPKPAGGVQLGTQEYQRAMKLCKFASSAIQYEDANTAIDNLTKALNLLTTGKET